MSSYDKGYRGVAMEGPIAKWYASNTRKDASRHRGMAEEVARRIPPGSRVLEVAPGPGYFSIELARSGDYRITGLDISQSFVDMARVNACKAGVEVDFRLGNASAMPFPDRSFDFIFCQAAFKNFSRPVEAIAEMHRVLAPGGAALIIDLRRDVAPEAIEQAIAEMNSGPINRLITRWTFQHMLLKRAYTKEEMEQFVAQTPFRGCEIEEDGIGFRVWLRK